MEAMTSLDSPPQTLYSSDNFSTLDSENRTQTVERETSDIWTVLETVSLAIPSAGTLTLFTFLTFPDRKLVVH